MYIYLYVYIYTQHKFFCKEIKDFNFFRSFYSFLSFQYFNEYLIPYIIEDFARAGSA